MPPAPQEPPHISNTKGGEENVMHAGNPESVGDRPALLKRVMEYPHPGLLARLQEKVEPTPEKAAELFADMKRFLFLAGTVPGPLAPPEPIDEAWHNFILFTEDYAAFCQAHFGRFIHHVPVGPDDRAARDGSILRNTIRAAREVFGDTLSLYWNGAFAKCTDKCAPSTNCQTQSRTKCTKD